MVSNIGILLTNIGTPDEPTPSAVRRYLHEFLSDRRVVELPRIIWWPILHGFILRTRPKKSAKLYQKIWRTEGSPLLHYSREIAHALEKKLSLPVVLGMHYGKPSIKQALNELREKNIEKIIVLPLYPQYSATTTASTFDRVTDELKTWRKIPEICTINDYATDPNYIKCISDSIRHAEQTQGKPDHLLFSFHGIPQQYANAGDPYPEHCKATARLVAEALQLKAEDWSLAYQSRLGRAKWLSPYTDKVLAELGQRGCKKIHVICPGFAADCLETLEEIAIRGKEQFLAGGGKELYYIPALNNTHDHIDLFYQLVTHNIQIF